MSVGKVRCPYCESVRRFTTNDGKDKTVKCGNCEKLFLATLKYKKEKK